MKAFLLEKGPVIRRRTLLVLVAGVPIVFHRSVHDPFNVPKLALLVFGVTLVAALRVAEIIQGASNDGLKRMWIPAVAVVAPLFVAWLFSSYKGWALLGLYGRFQGLIPYLLLVALGVLIADAFAGETLPLAWAFVAGGAVMGGYALLQWLEMDPFDWQFQGGPGDGIAISTVGNPNFTGGYLGVVLPVAVGLLIHSKKGRATAATALALVVAGWIVADSQGGWGAGLAGTAIVLGFFFAPRWKLARPIGLSMAVLTLIVGLVAVFAAVAAPDNGITSTTVRWRGWWWQAAGDMAADSPVWGHGPNVFAYEGVHYRVGDEASELNYNFADDPHSVFMSFLANAGALGAIGFLTLMGWVVMTARRIPELHTWGPIWLGGVAAYFAQALVSIDELSLRLALWTTIAGLVASLQPPPPRAKVKARSRSRHRRPEPVKAWPGLVALGTVVLVAAWWATNLMVADGRALAGVRSFARGQPEEGRSEFDKALDFRSENVYRQSFGYQLGQAGLAQKPEGGTYIEASQEAYAYLDEFPDIGGLVSEARILHAYADVDPQLEQEALDLYMRAIEHDPLNPMIRVECSDVLNTMGRSPEAVDLLEEAIETGERYADWWGALALSRALAGDTSGALEAMNKAFALVPTEGRALRAQEILSGAGN